MPSVSAKQARTMAAAAHNPKFAKKMGIPQSVAADFNKADAKSGLLSRAMKRRKPASTVLSR
jgi:hypothetical protein